jgi:hypothetical protein
VLLQTKTKLTLTMLLYWVILCLFIIYRHFGFFSYSGGIFRCSGGIFRCSGGIPVVGVLLHAQKRDMRAAKQARQFHHAMQILNHYQYSFL